MKTSRKYRHKGSLVNSIPHGKDNALTAKELATLHKCQVRDIQRAIEHDRRHGYAICASVTGEQKGFYRANTPDELEIYCQSLDRRLEEITKTRNAVKSTLFRWQQGEPPKGEGIV